MLGPVVLCWGRGCPARCPPTDGRHENPISGVATCPWGGSHPPPRAAALGSRPASCPVHPFLLEPQGRRSSGVLEPLPTLLCPSGTVSISLRAVAKADAPCGRQDVPFPAKSSRCRPLALGNISMTSSGEKQAPCPSFPPCSGIMMSLSVPHWSEGPENVGIGGSRWLMGPRWVGTV